MSSPSNILIIGGTRGIGLEFVRQTVSPLKHRRKLYWPVYPQLSQNPSATVFVTARDPTKATELQALAATSNNRAQILAADATNADSLKAAAEKITSLDRIIYNAGVLAGWGNPLEVGFNALKQNIDTNLYGPYFTAVQFAPLLLKSTYKNKALVFLSSSFGSLGLADEIKASHGVPGYDPSALYNVSKVRGLKMRIVMRNW
jgi:NAD(P)-dependent dehydrogenase (short-subunit alcohol dehydrogenase family)